jgi:hypothetical protein
LSCFSCSLNFIQHDANKARIVAETFSEQAFIKRDYANALKLLRSDRANDFTASSLQTFVESMHPEGIFPEKLSAAEYEVVPGQRIVNIYLRGTINAADQYYLIVVVGDKGNGYEVSEIYRRETPFPTSSIPRKLF